MIENSIGKHEKIADFDIDVNRSCRGLTHQILSSDTRDLLDQKWISFDDPAAIRASLHFEIHHFIRLFHIALST